MLFENKTNVKILSQMLMFGMISFSGSTGPVLNEPRQEKISLRSDTNQVVQPQKMARGLTFRIEEEEAG